MIRQQLLDLFYNENIVCCFFVISFDVGENKNKL